MSEDIILKKNFIEQKAIVYEKGKVIMMENRTLPKDFESMINLIISNNKHNNIDVLDNITVSVRVGKNKYLIYHKTLLDNVVDISVKYNNIRVNTFMSISLKTAYYMICEYL